MCNDRSISVLRGAVLQGGVLLLLLAPGSAHSMACSVEGSGETLLRGDFGASLAIPATLPDGAVLWRSEEIQRRVTCMKDTAQTQAEEVVLQVNPTARPLGAGVRIGITWQGVDYHQQAGHIATGAHLPACPAAGTAEPACAAVSLDLRLSVFLEKFGVTPYSGQVSHQASYEVFRLGSHLESATPVSSSLTYQLDNLAGLRFVGCDAQLQVLPENIDFGKVAMQDVEVGAVAATRTFTLLSTRACETSFSVDARLQAVSGVVSDKLLVPLGNDSVGIRVSRADDATVIPFNRYFHLVDLLRNTPSALSRFNAELVWRTARPLPGPFTAEVLIDLVYK